MLSPNSGREVKPCGPLLASHPDALEEAIHRSILRRCGGRETTALSMGAETRNGGVDYRFHPTNGRWRRQLRQLETWPESPEWHITPVIPDKLV